MLPQISSNTTPQVSQKNAVPEVSSDFTTVMKSMARKMRSKKSQKNQPGPGATTDFTAQPVANVTVSVPPPIPPSPTPPSPVKSGHFQYVHIANKGSSWNNSSSSLTSQRIPSSLGPSSARPPESIATHQPTDFKQSWTNQRQQHHPDIHQVSDQGRSKLSEKSIFGYTSTSPCLTSQALSIDSYSSHSAPSFIAPPQQPQPRPPRASHSLPPRPSQATAPVFPAGMTKSARKKLRKQQAEAAAAAAAAATSATPPNPSVTVNSMPSTSNSMRPSATSSSYMQSDLPLSTVTQLSSGRPKTPPSTPVSTRVTRSSMSMSSPVAQPATNRSSTAMSSPAAQPATNRSKNASPVIVSRGSAGDLQLELQPAMLEGIPIVTGNKVSRKAAGECILRAVVYTLSRNYAFISKDLFMQLYRNNFGCPGLDDKPMILDAGLLDNKMVAPIIQVQVLNHVKYYRLIPAYFERFGMPQNLHSTTKKQPTLFADHNKSKLPPIQALTPNAVMALVEDFDTRFINIATIFPELCPSRLCKSAGLQEFSRFIPLWCPELHPSATVPPKLISPTKPNSMTDDELNQLQIATVPPKLFGLLLQKARGTGMAAKRARIMLIRHSARLLQPLEDERLKIRRQLLQTHPLANTSNSPLTSTNSSGRNIPTPVPQQAEQLKDKNEVIVPSPELTTAMEDMNMDIDAQLPNFSSSTKAPESTPILNIEVTRYTADQLSVGSQQAMIHSHVLSETMDIPGETLAQEQDGTLKSGTQGHIKPSQGSQLRAMLKQERFKPYPSLNETNGGSALSKNGSSQKKALPNHSKTSGSGGSSGSAENSNHKKEMNSLGYIPPSGDGIFTLPRPILPPLEGRAGPMSGMPPMASFDPSISVAGMEESNLMMSGTLLRPTRDQILKERREALNQVIEYVWKLPMRAA